MPGLNLEGHAKVAAAAASVRQGRRGPALLRAWPTFRGGQARRLASQRLVPPVAIACPTRCVWPPVIVGCASRAGTAGNAAGGRVGARGAVCTCSLWIGVVVSGTGQTYGALAVAAGGGTGLHKVARGTLRQPSADTVACVRCGYHRVLVGCALRQWHTDAVRVCGGRDSLYGGTKRKKCADEKNMEMFLKKRHDRREHPKK